MDSNLTHSFINTALAHRIGLIPTPCLGLIVGVTNGERVPSMGICKEVHLVIDREEFIIDLYTIPLEGYDMVLGCDWLRTLGPMLWDFDRLTMMFWRHDHRVMWVGTNGRPSARLEATDVRELMTLLVEESRTSLPHQRACLQRVRSTIAFTCYQALHQWQCAPIATHSS